MTNPDQAYKKEITAVFSRGSDLYSKIGPQFFNHFGRSLVKHAGIQAGEQVLDIACGRGAVLFPAHEKSGMGQVIGIDLAEGMVKETQQEIQQRGLKNLDIHHMDAEKLQFPANFFDAVLCGFAMFFLPKIDVTLAGISRVLKPGGILAFSTFGESTDERWKHLNALNKSYYDRMKPQPKIKTKSLESPEEINEILIAAGFTQIEIIEETRDFYYKDAAEWWATIWTHGYRFFLEMMTEETLAAYKKEALPLVDQLKTTNGIPESYHVLLTRAVRP